MASDTTDRPRFTLFAGPNGAGKTTAYRRFLDAGFEAAEYLNPDDIARAMATDEIKGELRQNTEALAQRGGFGTPTFFVDGDDMYFGNDRMPLLRAALTA